MARRRLWLLRVLDHRPQQSAATAQSDRPGKHPSTNRRTCPTHASRGSCLTAPCPSWSRLYTSALRVPTPPRTNPTSQFKDKRLHKCFVILFRISCPMTLFNYSIILLFSPYVLLPHMFSMNLQCIQLTFQRESLQKPFLLFISLAKPNNDSSL